MTYSISHNFISLVVCLLLLLECLPNSCWGWERAEDGAQQQQEHSSSGSSTSSTSSATKEEEESMVNQVHIAAKLKELSSNGISNDDAISIAGLLDALMVDEETRQLVSNLRQAEDENNGSQDPQLQAFLDDATPKEIVIGLKQLIGELRGIEYLFRDPKRAVEEMYKEGMFKESQLGLYRENPAKLAQDVESGLYFSFVTLAVAGGFL
mmetsp:Transcript_48093/g.48952  ORF Transcript_48093/g.48952 Transcript_48093/m.48952 type:complete len:209 (-) Transcript_48093:49-675(-)